MGRKPEGKAEKMFKKIGKKMDELIQDLDKARDQAKEDYADQINELKRNTETLKNKFYDFKEKHKDSFDEAEKNLEKAGEELKTAFNKVFKKNEQQKKET